MATSVTEGFLRHAGLTAKQLEQPETIVAPRSDYEGAGLVAWYRIEGSKATVLWSDPDRMSDLTDLADASSAIERVDFEKIAAGRGAELLGRSRMRTLHEPAGPFPAVEPPPGYGHEQLTATATEDMIRIHAFVDRCDPADVEKADLDDLDDEFDDDEIHVLTVPGDAGEPDEIVAYASAARWDWDPELGDLGVLVAAEHRRRGLGRWVVAATSNGLRSKGRTPLYRHDLDNERSAALAQSLGFVPMVELSVWQLSQHWGKRF